MFTSLRRRGYVSKNSEKEGKRVQEHLSKRGKVAATFMAMLLVITFTAALLPKATATPTLTISIYPISGTVGTEVKVNGTIDTFNGSYTIRWDGTYNVTGDATGYNVTKSFVIPPTVGAPFPGRDVSIELIDNNKTTAVNATFTLYTKYHIETVVPSPPYQLQEGQTTEIRVNITGGEANTIYSANITVTDPSGAVYYNDTLQLTNTTNTGYGEGNTTYPANFSLGANTDYVGIYAIAFNGTLATGNFTVGLTDRTEYPRMRTVKIRGAGYNASEDVTVDITKDGLSIAGFPRNRTADSNGVLTDSWAIPIDATAGTYKATLTNASTPGTIKTVPDVQNFTVIETLIPLAINPPSGRWGTEIRVVGEIVTLNGSYEIRWDGKSIKDGTCVPGSAEVDDTFLVPPSTLGSHNVTLYDVSESMESIPSRFNVTASLCHVSADPTRIQEGLNTSIIVTVNEAEANATLTFTINVTHPRLAFDTATLDVSTNATGSGSNSILYYGDFSASANTSYVGTYNISVLGDNELLAKGNFTVGLTDRLAYGRTETETRVDIRGAGYESDEVMSINITFAGVPIAGYPELTISDAEGVVTYFWQIPKDAQLGTYTVTLANETGVQIKPIPDIQNFTVNEIIVYCETQNKYDENPLADVTVEAYRAMNIVDSGKTNKTGFVDLRLDFGEYIFKALWKGQEVGSLENQSVTGNATLPPIKCALASVTIAVKDEAGRPLPLIDLTLTSNETGPLPLPETGSTGIVATNAFTNISYWLEAWRYGHLFFNQSIGNLTSTRRINITCPTYTMFVHVLDSNGLPIKNVEVVVYEWSSERITESETTDALGSVTLDVTFGRYRVRVCNYSAEWSRLVVFNETVIDLTEDQQFVVIHCRISNLELSVVVTDYFGQPIPNARVKVERDFGQEYVTIANLKTKSDGTVFLPKIGGRYRISVYVTEKLFDINTLYLDEPKVIAFKIDKLVVIGGYPLEISQFLTCILLVIMALVFGLALIYRRFRPRMAPEGEEKEKSL